MKKDYLKFFECPKCGSESLELKSADLSMRVKEGLIRCSGCGAVYPVKNYIPRFSFATPYADSFGPQWRSFAKSQIAEFGSGAGRFVDVLSRRGANLVVGLDATDATDAAQDNLADRENVFVRARRHFFAAV